jgi:hypothetical protein
MENALDSIIAQFQQGAHILDRAFSAKLVDLFFKAFRITAVNVQPFDPLGEGFLADSTLKATTLMPHITFSSRS